MKLPLIIKRSSLSAVLLTVCLSAAQAQPVPDGFISVTAAPFFADPTGTTDSTAALQAAINAGRDQRLVVWFPAGTYRVSSRIEIDQPDNQGYTPVVLMGSTVNPAARATILLAPNAPGFGNPAARRAMIHFFNIGTADAESGNTDLYDQAVIGLDLKIGAGNSGAVALRMQSAEGSTIQDVNIDLTEGGHTGIWGIPGSGGSTHRVTITGGVIGIDTIKPNGEYGGSQPTPVVTGSTFINQSSWAIRSAVRGPLVLVGCRFERNTPGAFFNLLRHWSGQPFDGSLQLIDSSLSYATPHAGNTVIAMGTNPGRSFLFDNVHVRHAPHIWTTSAPATANGWHHFSRLAVEVRPEARSWGQALEVVWQNGTPGSSLLVEGTSGIAPPADLQSRHQWAADFPTWEHPGVIDVTTLGAVGDGVTDNRAVLQAAIDTHEKLFFPKGVFAVSGTLDLRPDTKLLGAYPVFSTIAALSTLTNRFGGVAPEAPDAPIVRTADTAAAETWLSLIQIKRLFPLAMHNPTTPGNHALEWRSGGNSLLRQVMLESDPATNVRPDFIAKVFYGYNTDNASAPNYRPISPNHPQGNFLPGHHAWPCATPNVIVRGNGGGRWFSFWFHGRQALRQETPFLRVENTIQPLHFYHLHLQQQDSRHHAEFYRAANVSIYGVKGEVKGAILKFEQSDNIRIFGLSGRLSPDASYFDQHLVRFLHTSDFSLSGLNDTIQEQPTAWFGGEFDRWIHAHILEWRPLDDVHGLRPTVSVPSLHRPLLYLRGAPSAVPVPALPLVATITGPADAAQFAQGQTVTLSGSVIDRQHGDVSSTGLWSSDIDGSLGSGSSLTLSNLSPGTHTIRFEAANSRGDYSVETRTLIIHPYGTELLYQVNPQADTYVRGGAETHINYGNSTTLRVRSSEHSEALLRFPLPENLLGEITTANLTFNLNANDSGTLVVHQLANLTWDEMTVTGATRPTRGAALGQLVFNGNQNTPQTLDVSGYLLDTIASNAPAIGFAATSPNLLRLRSRESSDPARHPRLIITTTIPVPPNTAPTVTITGPADNTAVPQGSEVILTGTATDFEDGNIAASATWTSSLDGALGNGGNLSTASLSLGTHIITFSATDSGGLSDSKQITLTVELPVYSVTFGTTTGGSLTGSTNQSVTSGNPTTAVAAVADSGYQFVNWTWSGGNSSTDNPLIITNVTQALAVTANFEALPPPPSALFFQNFGTSSTVADYAGSADHRFDFLGTDTSTNNRAALSINSGRIRNTVAYSNDGNTNQLSAVRLTRRTNLPVEDNFAVVSAKARLAPQSWPAGDTTYLGFTIGQNFRTGIFNPAGGTGNGPAFASLNLQARATANTFRTTGVGGNSSTFTVTPSGGVYSIDLVVAANGGTQAQTFPSPTGDHTVQPGRVSVWINGTLHLNNTATGVTAANLVNFSFSTGSGTAQGFSSGSVFNGHYEIDDIVVQTVSNLIPPNTAPTVTITGPADNSTVPQGSEVILTGTATDFEDGNIAASATWTSSLDGVLGNGGSLSTASLSLGTHIITFAATDSGGLSDSKQVTLTVELPVYSVTFGTTTGGSLTGSTNQSVTSGNPTTAVTAVADSGYQFVNWTWSGGNSSTDNPLIITNVTQALAVTANFEALPPPPSALFFQNFGTSSTVADYAGSADHRFDFLGTDTSTNNRAALSINSGRIRNTVAYSNDGNTNQLSAVRLTRRTNLPVEDNFAVVSAKAYLAPQSWPAGDTTYLGFTIGQNFRSGIFNPAGGTGNGPQFAGLNIQARATANTFRTTGVGGNSSNFTVTPTGGVYTFDLVVAANGGAQAQTFPSPTGDHTIQPGRVSVWINGTLHLNNTPTGVTAANLVNFSFSTGSGTAQGFSSGSVFNGHYEIDDVLVQTVSNFAAP